MPNQNNSRNKIEKYISSYVCLGYLVCGMPLSAFAVIYFVYLPALCSVFRGRRFARLRIYIFVFVASFCVSALNFFHFFFLRRRCTCDKRATTTITTMAPSEGIQLGTPLPYSHGQLRMLLFLLMFFLPSTLN